MTSTATSPIPVTIVGGYLGAGKTTLVNHVLRHAGGRRIAVLVNDFGALPIDADLIEGSDGGVLSLAGGCVCCSYGDDLVDALISIAARNPRPDVILLETSGVALPGAVARSLTLLADLTLDAVLVLADAETTRARLADRYMADTLARQFAEADLIVLNKRDLCSPVETDLTTRAIAAIAPGTRLVETVHGQLPLDIVFGPAIGASRRITTGAAHDAASHAEVSLTFGGPVDVEALADGLAQLDLVRAKGIVRDYAGTWRIVQRAGARTSITAAPTAISGPSRLVCIAHRRRLDPAAVKALLAHAGATEIGATDIKQ